MRRRRSASLGSVKRSRPPVTELFVTRRGAPWQERTPPVLCDGSFAGRSVPSLGALCELQTCVASAREYEIGAQCEIDPIRPGASRRPGARSPPPGGARRHRRPQRANSRSGAGALTGARAVVLGASPASTGAGSSSTIIKASHLAIVRWAPRSSEERRRSPLRVLGRSTRCRLLAPASNMILPAARPRSSPVTAQAIRTSGA
jgi:hypothetical protein